METCGDGGRRDGQNARDVFRAHIGTDRLGAVVRVAVDRGWFEVTGSATEEADVLGLAQGHPDVLVLDADRLPSGADVLSQVHEASPDTKIVVVSGADESTAAADALGGGAVAYLGAEMSGERMVEEIRELISAALGKAGTRLSAEPANAARARRMVGGVLQTWGLDDMVDTVVLLLSELVTNGIRHARSDVDVVVKLMRDDAVRVEVVDSGADIPRPRHAGANAESGRGLTLVDAIAGRWGVEPRGAGKVVWFELPVGGDGAAPETVP